nr:hypothetical protein [Actinomycetota bacterium]
VTHLVGLDARGGRHLLPHTLVGPGGLNQVRRQLRRLVRRGRAEQVCRDVARRLAADTGRRHAHIVEVRVVTGRYHFDDYFAGRRDPVAERVDASHAVARA